ncbi:hypothetical protein [Aquisphaera insulae]|uniref:hypothetical protein n=1 Tax=Aquisphaera insulae TaxID=2712864 RepID=UPI0013E9F76C|nr:hypothetical protein [Aquisphaera insulae]
MSGCADRGNILTGDPPPAQMKTSLSHFQYDNEKLRTEVAKLKEENRGLEDQLVQERLHNGDLTARLDDARNLIKDRGIDGGTRLSARPASPSTRDDADEALTGPVTKPAGRKTVKKRKPPSASIPGDLDDLPTASDGDRAEEETISLRDPTPLRTEPSSRERTRTRDRESLTPDDDDSIRWQPVAASPPESTPRR